MLDDNDHPELERQVRRHDRQTWRRAALWSFGFVALLWWIKLVESMLDRGLDAFGVVPRDPLGLIGVFTAPLIHGSWEHLISNTLPLLVLGSLALYAYPLASRRAFPLIWLLSGIGTWLIGRESSHIGASGLGHGLMFFLFTLGVVRWEPRSIAVALVTFLLYGGMVITILPREAGVSWEYHLSGAIAGLIAALLWRKLDPRAPRRKYSWEIEEELAREAATREADEYELPSPLQVPVLWSRPTAEEGRRLLQFPMRADTESESDDEPPAPTRH